MTTATEPEESKYLRIHAERHPERGAIVTLYVVIDGHQVAKLGLVPEDAKRVGRELVAMAIEVESLVALEQEGTS